jgi:hypothetical protein
MTRYAIQMAKDKRNLSDVRTNINTDMENLIRTLVRREIPEN